MQGSGKSAHVEVVLLVKCRCANSSKKSKTIEVPTRLFWIWNNCGKREIAVLKNPICERETAMVNVLV